MGKRTDSQYPRRERDFYRTPPEAMEVLWPHLLKRNGHHFIEPMCGDGAIVEWLENVGMVCVYASDIEPVGDARRYAKTASLQDLAVNPARYYQKWPPGRSDIPIVTNPPWPHPKAKPGEPTIGFIKNMLELCRDAYVLLSGDFLYTVQMVQLMPRLKALHAVGRVSWEQNGVAGKDNCAWYHFGPERTDCNGTVCIDFSVNPGRRKHKPDKDKERDLPLQNDFLEDVV